jgi:hypothetical protein
MGTKKDKYAEARAVAKKKRLRRKGQLRRAFDEQHLHPGVSDKFAGGERVY